MIYFKKVEHCLNELKEKQREVEKQLADYLVNEPDSETTDSMLELKEQKLLIDRQIDAIKEILEYIHKAEWVTTKDAYERVMYCLRHGLKKAAEKYNCSENSMRVTLSKASTKVETLIGSETLPLIMEGEVDKALFKLRKNTRNLCDLVINEAVSYIIETATGETIESKRKNNGAMPEELKDIELQDCTEELKVFVRYSKTHLENTYKTLDKRKLQYLSCLLTTKDEEYATQQQQLYNILTRKGRT